MSTLENITIDKDKQEAVLDQALKLFMRHGIKSMTMDDVANHLHISKKTLYQFVTDKNDLVERAVSRMHAAHTTWHRCHLRAGPQRLIRRAVPGSRSICGLLSQVHPSIHYDLENIPPQGGSSSTRRSGATSTAA